MNDDKDTPRNLSAEILDSANEGEYEDSEELGEILSEWGMDIAIEEGN